MGEPSSIVTFALITSLPHEPPYFTSITIRKASQSSIAATPLTIWSGGAIEKKSEDLDCCELVEFSQGVNVSASVTIDARNPTKSASIKIPQKR